MHDIEALRIDKWFRIPATRGTGQWRKAVVLAAPLGGRTDSAEIARYPHTVATHATTTEGRGVTDGPAGGTARHPER